jgi:predicted ATPase
LTEQTNHVLALASVLGREFPVEGLVRMADITEHEVTSALEEGARAALVDEQQSRGLITHRFTHALFRQTLYEELSAPRRSRLHQQAAKVLEQLYGGHLEDHAAEIAEHYTNSSNRIGNKPPGTPPRFTHAAMPSDVSSEQLRCRRSVTLETSPDAVICCSRPVRR